MKKRLKDFWSNHSGEIILGTGLAIQTLIVFRLVNNNKSLSKYISDITQSVAEGCKLYVADDGVSLISLPPDVISEIVEGATNAVAEVVT